MAEAIVVANQTSNSSNNSSSPSSFQPKDQITKLSCADISRNVVIANLEINVVMLTVRLS